MRKDENGIECPETLGEYRRICASFGGDDCKAVAFLDEKIAESPNGVDEVVVAADSQMRLLLFPMMTEKAEVSA